MENIKATLPGIGEVTVVWFLVSNKETRAVYVTPTGRLGAAPLDNFRDVGTGQK